MSYFADPSYLMFFQQIKMRKIIIWINLYLYLHMYIYKYIGGDGNFVFYLNSSVFEKGNVFYNSGDTQVS